MAAVTRLFRVPPDVPRLDTSPEEMRATYRYFRIRQLYTTFIGYAVFYFVRKNIPVAIPALESELQINNAQLGVVLTVHDVVYGVAKFVNGFLGDRANPRFFMPVGLLLSALMNLAFGMSTGLLTLGIFWTLNAWFQGMGFPPCARILSHWFAPKERGTMWGIWNTSHQVGAALILVIAGVLVRHFGWRACFLVPGVFAIGIAVFLTLRLRDTPGSLGLPPIEAYAGDGSHAEAAPASGHEDMDPAEFRRFIRKNVFGNKFIWCAASANFFVYVVRYGFVNWGPLYLNKTKGIPLDWAGAMLAGFEIAGLVGSLIAGWLTDRLFRSRRGPVCVIYMFLLAVAIFAFWKLPLATPLVDAGLLVVIGFLVYGPQFLVGVLTVDLATKRAAATAIGLTGLFGYSSGLVSGWGLGYVLDHHGWDGAFFVLAVCAVIGGVLFAFTWNAAATDAAAPAVAR